MLPSFLFFTRQPLEGLSILNQSLGGRCIAARGFQYGPVTDRDWKRHIRLAVLACGVVYLIGNLQRVSRPSKQLEASSSTTPPLLRQPLILAGLTSSRHTYVLNHHLSLRHSFL